MARNKRGLRPPAVAGAFYPVDPAELREAVAAYLGAARAAVSGPKALIAPHAGYIYSGPVAASAYACLCDLRSSIRRVVILGPAHRIHLRGLALPSCEGFRTPLGDIAIDHAAAADLRGLPQVAVRDDAHALEHSIEVQLPFLQSVVEEFSVVPLVVGECPPHAVSEVIEALWGGPETAVIVSSDLSHYHDYDAARALDLETSRAIEARRTDLAPERACGCVPINGLLALAAAKGLSVTRLDLRNSGDTAGGRGRVVGYGAYAIH